MTRRHILSLTVIAALGLAVLHASALAQGPALPPELQKVRAALDKYQDPYVAVRDGYLSTVGCVHYPKPGGPGRVAYPAGAMGIHFLNAQLIGPVPDPMRPPILVYEPSGDTLKLVAAEWLIPLATGIKERPTLFGKPFEGPMMGHEPLMPAGLHHYDLHVWLWKENPSGLFSPTNPSVTCTGYQHALAEEAPHITPHPQH
jgi:hypothetical protein